MSAPKGVLFVSTPPARALPVIDSLHRRWPDHEWTVCVKERERTKLPAELAAIPLPRWRPGFTAWRRLRAGRFDISIACWMADDGYGRLKWMHLRLPARERHIYNENIDSFEIFADRPNPSLEAHLRWRMGQPGPRSGGAIAGVWRAMYAATLGPVIGCGIVLVRHLAWCLGLGPRARTR